MGPPFLSVFLIYNVPRLTLGQAGIIFWDQRRRCGVP